MLSLHIEFSGLTLELFDGTACSLDSHTKPPVAFLNIEVWETEKYPNF